MSEGLHGICLVTMPTEKTWYRNISRTFPAGDPVAALIARCLVLLADLRVEQPGIHAESGLEVLERVGTVHRRMYFMRGLSRTLHEVRALATELRLNPTFACWLTEFPDEALRYDEHRASLEAHRTLITKVRNSIGAHVGEDVGASLDSVPPDYSARMKWSSEDGLRPEMVEWLLLVALFPGATEVDLKPRFKDAQHAIWDASSRAVDLLGVAIDLYDRRHRPIFPV